MNTYGRQGWMVRAVVGLSMALAGCMPEVDDSSQEACVGPLGPPITSFAGMTACGQAEGGQGHCVDDAALPAELKPFLAACDGGQLCVPDQFLRTGGAEPPTSCTAFGGDGVCLSITIPDVAANALILKQDGCTTGVDPDLYCVPCISPLDSMPTGACDLRQLAQPICPGDEDPTGPGPSPAACDDPSTCVYEASCAPFLDPSTLPSCAADAHCVDRALLAGTDPSLLERLGACEGGGAVCVPDLMIRTNNKFTPATCTSINAAEGRCLSKALPEVAGQAELLPSEGCGGNEACVPCYDPVTGASTGACDLSCDVGPTQPAAPLAACCDGRARCVPTGLVPADQQDQLEQDSCEDLQEDAFLCVPVEILADGPFPTCSADSFILGDYTGVCLSDCLDFGIQGLALARGSCGSGFKCAPCERDGAPTGAPGCPPTP